MAPSRHRPPGPSAAGEERQVLRQQGGLGATGQGGGSEQHRQHLQGEESARSQREGGCRGAEETRGKVGGSFAITAAVPSGWRSPPRPRPSARTQTGPGGAEGGGEPGGSPRTGLGAAREGAWGTLVCTMPGRWSRMCSSVAAMSISFTPGGEARGRAEVRAEPPPAASQRGQKRPRHRRTFGHAVQDHVDEDVGPGPACAITARRGCLARGGQRRGPACPCLAAPPGPSGTCSAR